MTRNLASVTVCLCALVTGCSVAYVERISPTPVFFIQFEQEQADLNNKYIIQNKINEAVKEIEDSVSLTWIVVASGNSPKDYTLAFERMVSFSHAINTGAVRLVVQPLERPEQVDMLAVYHTTQWNKENKLFFLDNEFTTLSNVNDVYRASDKRQFYATPTKRTITLKGEDIIAQFDSVLTKLGWSLNADDANRKFEKQLSVPSIDVVLLGENATKFEIKMLVEIFIKKALQKHEYQIDFENKTVRLWQSSIF